MLQAYRLREHIDHFTPDATSAAASWVWVTGNLNRADMAAADGLSYSAKAEPWLIHHFHIHVQRSGVMIPGIAAQLCVLTGQQSSGWLRVLHRGVQSWDKAIECFGPIFSKYAPVIYTAPNALANGDTISVRISYEPIMDQ